MRDWRQTGKLENGVAETEAVPGSASKITTRYFGNELETDLMVITAKMSHLFNPRERRFRHIFMRLRPLNTKEGYVGSDGYF